MSIGFSARLVLRFGIRPPLTAGLLFAALGLLLLARAPVDGNYVIDVLPSMMLLGLGAGIAFNPVLLAAMSDVEPTEAGLVNTSFMMGGALGLAVLASLAASRTDALLADGSSEAGRAHRRLPRRVSRGRDLRDGRGRTRRPAAPCTNAAALGSSNRSRSPQKRLRDYRKPKKSSGSYRRLTASSRS
jgi:hypothetical protein